MTRRATTVLAALIGVGLALVLIGVLRPHTARAGSSDIRGTVTFTGKAPAAKVLSMTGAPHCAKAGEKDEAVVVNDNGTLRDVHVRIKSGTAGKHEAPAASVVIDQKDCVYRPRVSGAMQGQNVRVTNGDPTMHNVHGYRKKRTAFNRPQPAGAPAIESKKLGKAGDVFTFKCDVHGWMVAYVPLTDHPYFDVTGATGEFRLKNVPSGKTFTIEAWHPVYGLKTAEGKAGDTLSLSFP